MIVIVFPDNGLLAAMSRASSLVMAWGQPPIWCGTRRVGEKRRRLWKLGVLTTLYVGVANNAQIYWSHPTTEALRFLGQTWFLTGWAPQGSVEPSVIMTLLRVYSCEN